MSKERFFRSIRLLAQCYQAFEQLSGTHVRSLGLTPSQFDIIATLGNTDGMTFKELGEKTLITKGTLTGVVDRLAEKGLVKRVLQSCDRRSSLVQLTSSGKREFERVFAPHAQHCRQAFSGYRAEDFDNLEHELARLKTQLDNVTAKLHR